MMKVGGLYASTWPLGFFLSSASHKIALAMAYECTMLKARLSFIQILFHHFSIPRLA